MEDQLKELIALMTANVQREAAEAEAKKAAETAPQYVTADDLKEVFASFSEQVSKAIAEAVEAAVPVRAEGAGRAGEPGEAQKANEMSVVETLAKTPVDQLTREQKELKADLIRTIALKGMK